MTMLCTHCGITGPWLMDLSCYMWLCAYCRVKRVSAYTLCNQSTHVNPYYPFKGRTP